MFGAAEVGDARPARRFAEGTSASLFLIFGQILGFGAAGMVPKGAHLDFLQIPGLNSVGSFIWFPKTVLGIDFGSAERWLFDIWGAI